MKKMVVIFITLVFVLNALTACGNSDRSGMLLYEDGQYRDFHLYNLATSIDILLPGNGYYFDYSVSPDGGTLVGVGCKLIGDEMVSSDDPRLKNLEIDIYHGSMEPKVIPIPENVLGSLDDHPHNVHITWDTNGKMYLVLTTYNQSILQRYNVVYEVNGTDFNFIRRVDFPIGSTSNANQGSYGAALEKYIYNPSLWEESYYIYDSITNQASKLPITDNTTFPVWTPDMQSITYFDYGDIQVCLMTMDTASFATKIILCQPQSGSVNGIDQRWSPDGKYLAFTFQAWDIYTRQSFVIDMNQPNMPIVANLKDFGYIGDIYWSPDSKSITFIANRGEGTSFNLYTMKLGETPRKIYTSEYWSYDNLPWSYGWFK